MAHNIPFPSAQICHPDPLSLALLSLDEWALVTLEGADAVKYLHSQVTSDIMALANNQHQLCGHCDAKGKMWSTLRVFHRGTGLAYLERRSVLPVQLAELKKYAVFAKVTIVENQQIALLGVAGKEARHSLATLFPQLPDAQQPVVHHVTVEGESTLLYFPTPEERFLLVLPPTEAQQLINHLADKAQQYDSQQWLALDIASGYPIIDATCSGQFIPQATNLQALEGISFTKGCYTGQEMVARAKYRGANKRALYWLEGKSSHLPISGEELEMQLGDNWRRTGTVLSSCRLDDDVLWVQAVLNHDLSSDTRLRVKEDINSRLIIKALPYVLEEETE